MDKVWTKIYCNFYFRGITLSSVHTTPEKLENEALFLRFTSIRQKNGAFRKRSSNLRNLKTLALRFSVDWKYFENCLKTELQQVKHMSSNTNRKWPLTLLRFQISPAKCGRKTFDAVSGWKSIVKFLRRSVYGVLGISLLALIAKAFLFLATLLTIYSAVDSK